MYLDINYVQYLAKTVYISRKAKQPINQNEDNSLYVEIRTYVCSKYGACLDPRARAIFSLKQTKLVQNLQI